MHTHIILLCDPGIPLLGTYLEEKHGLFRKQILGRELSICLSVDILNKWIKLSNPKHRDWEKDKRNLMWICVIYKRLTVDPQTQIDCKWKNGKM